MELNEIIEYVNNCGSCAKAVFGATKSGGYELNQNPNEIAALIFDMQRKKIKNYLEIGTLSGGLTRLFSDLLIIEDMYTIDLDVDRWNPKPGLKNKNFSKLKNSGTHIHYEGDSHGTKCKDWLESLGVKFDFVFIDGDHLYGGVRLDTLLVLPYLKKDSIVVFHDTNVDNSVCKVRDFIDDIKAGKLPELDCLEFKKNYNHKQGIMTYTYKGGK